MTAVCKRLAAGTVLLMAFMAGPVCADPAARGLEIAREAERRDQGFGDSQAAIRMVLKNRHGEESTREMRTRTMEVEGDGDKLFIIFDTPRDVYGTAFLSFTHINEPDDQWLYLPALKRVKRISSNNKSGPFVGSEFAYEDLVSQEVDKYTYKYLRDETLDATACFVVERYPAYEHSGYTKQIVWFDHTEYRPQKVEYYDRKDELLKTLTFRDYQQYRDQFWRAGEMFMQNHQTSKSTLLVWSGYEFQNGFTDRDFDTNSLKRAR
ncbi:MAG: outer membrane lipoprotein-sorting protein [Candidatus Omnitrophica bacterium]|nr:outer membrane lipoprotein-sorting protein [Candidatus Omnitrophota bacterium]MCB9719327.1 outer membrane lipoprotein-sorting protein [Candidatus Omnitrophota bacterium]